MQLNRTDVWFPAVKRAMQAKNYWHGSMDAVWDEAAIQAWQAYCDRFGFVHTDVPDFTRQEPDKMRAMTVWYRAEERRQRMAGRLFVPTVERRSIYEKLRDMLDQPLPGGIEGEVTQARQEKMEERGELEVADTDPLTPLRVSMEEDYTRSIRKALKQAARITMAHGPRPAGMPLVTERPVRAGKPERQERGERRFRPKIRPEMAADEVMDVLSQPREVENQPVDAPIKPRRSKVRESLRVRG